MPERLRETKCQNQTEICPSWLNECAIENLIRNGIIPSYLDAGDKTIVILPPKGYKPGDERTPTSTGTFEYINPVDGKSKGEEAFYEVPNNTAIKLQKIQGQILDELNSVTA